MTVSERRRPPCGTNVHSGGIGQDGGGVLVPQQLPERPSDRSNLKALGAATRDRAHAIREQCLLSGCLGAVVGRMRALVGLRIERHNHTPEGASLLREGAPDHGPLGGTLGEVSICEVEMLQPAAGWGEGRGAERADMGSEA